MQTRLRSDRGSGTPLVYIPGIDGSGALLLGNEAVLERAFRLVTLRHLSEESAACRERDHYAALASDVVAVLDTLGIARAVLVAESFGGAIALRCALDHPERVAALGIVNSFAWFPKRASLALGRVFAPLVLRPVFDWFRPRIAPWSLFGKLREADALRRFAGVRGVYFDRGYRRRLAMIQGLDLRDELHRIDQPVRLFAATHDRVVPSLRCARTMQERLPHATTSVVDGGGHLILPLASLPWRDWLGELANRARA